ncbi:MULTISPECIES: hypothetical protein [Paenibacillus]|uniref:DUF3899 domain-containing protein n=2 Tax=Paenibacillus TaxID=44249 RepID=A0A1V4H748_9BACL|nr:MULTISPECIES: hypothetical protein [Paenibacillus]MEC0228719.1 hypothetical protein [Paenibacillus alba]NQX67534.1 hypothetical protein [Paenibacillus alba]OPH46952.1 hypothetical protein BC351_13610 [Paenibacillus ferrarius]UKS24492.1 hypothetical protein LOZ80_23050 [Paenibacillus sp. HWE-109]
MMQSISDKLFMGSLILLMISVVVSGIGFQFINWRSQVNDELDSETKDSSSRKKAVIDRQDKSLSRVLRSYLFWIAIVGILVSIVLSRL